MHHHTLDTRKQLEMWLAKAVQISPPPHMESFGSCSLLTRVVKDKCCICLGLFLHSRVPCRWSQYPLSTVYGAVKLSSGLLAQDKRDPTFLIGFTYERQEYSMPLKILANTRPFKGGPLSSMLNSWLTVTQQTTDLAAKLEKRGSHSMAGNGLVLCCIHVALVSNLPASP